MPSITSANAVLVISVANLFPTPVQLQQFAADDIYTIDPLPAAEVVMGVDGRLSAGFVYAPVVQGISLQADSASNVLFDTWWAAERQARDKFFATGTITLTSIGRKYAMTQGALTTYPAIPDGARVLRPRKFHITWESIIPANI